MAELQDVARTIALTMGIGWASGINLYASIFVLGLLGATGNIVLPQGLLILAHPAVIVAAGFMYLLEFVVDKIPGVDSGWDALHTFIRIPAGAVLAAGAVGKTDPSIALAAAILGGGLAAGTHAMKSGTRVLINTSPEPFSNWVASVGEDFIVIAGLWTALHHPFLFLLLLAGFIALMIWILPKLWRELKRLFGFLANLVGGRKSGGSHLSK